MRLRLAKTTCNTATPHTRHDVTTLLPLHTDESRKKSSMYMERNEYMK